MLVSAYNLKPNFSSAWNKYKNVIGVGTSWEPFGYCYLFCFSSHVHIKYKNDIVKQADSNSHHKTQPFEQPVKTYFLITRP